MALYREQNSSSKNRFLGFLGFLFPVQDMSKVCMHLCMHFHSAQISDTEISVPCCSAHIALRYGDVQISILVWFMGFLLVCRSASWWGFWGFWVFCCFILCRSASWLGFWDFWVFCCFILCRSASRWGFWGFCCFILCRSAS